MSYVYFTYPTGRSVQTDVVNAVLLLRIRLKAEGVSFFDAGAAWHNVDSDNEADLVALRQSAVVLAVVDNSGPDNVTRALLEAHLRCLRAVVVTGVSGLRSHWIGLPSVRFDVLASGGLHALEDYQAAVKAVRAIRDQSSGGVPVP